MARDTTPALRHLHPVKDPPSPDATQVLVENHRRFLAFLTPRLGSRELAEEVLQAAFVKGIEHGDEIRSAESAIAWFYRLLRNAVTDLKRHRAAEQRALERHASEAAEATALGPELEQVVCQCVHHLIPTLKADYADLLRAVEMEGHTLAEIAAERGITSGNAAVRLHRARQALRKRLEVSCGTCAEHGCLDCDCCAH